MRNINQITAPRVDFLDQNGKIAREWYMYLYNLYAITGGGTGITPIINGGTGLGTLPTNGQLLIGDEGVYTLNTLDVGLGISVTNGPGTITIANTGVLSFSGGTTGLTPVAAAVGVVVLGGVLNAVNGGTGQSSYAIGDLLYADTATTLAKLADVATGNALISGGVATAPAWGKIGLTTHVSGVLPIANGGTNGTATPTAYGVSYGTGTAYAFTSAGTTGQILTATTGSAPTWASPVVNTVSAPITKTADFTVGNGEAWFINNKSGSTCVVTMPTASSWTGRSITVKNMQAQLVNSASSNIVPIDSTTAGTAIVLNVIGNWATMVSDGANWVIMQAASNNNLLLE